MALPTSPIPPIVQAQFNFLESIKGKHLSELQIRKFLPELIEWVAAQYYIGPMSRG